MAEPGGVCHFNCGGEGARSLRPVPYFSHISDFSLMKQQSARALSAAGSASDRPPPSCRAAPGRDHGSGVCREGRQVVLWSDRIYNKTPCKRPQTLLAAK